MNVYSRETIIIALSELCEDWDMKTWEAIVIGDSKKSYASLPNNELLEMAKEFAIIDDNTIIAENNEGFLLKEEWQSYTIYENGVLLMEILGDEELAKNILAGLKQKII